MKSRTRMEYSVVVTLVLPFVAMVGSAKAFSDLQFLDDFTG